MSNYKSHIIIGSRGSKLALWQANYVKKELENLGVNVEIKIIKTKGDKIQHLSFDKIEGKGFFTKEIEKALIDDEIDLAVHSLKDLETNQPEGLCLGAVPKRENPSDCLLINKDAFDESKELNIKKNAIVGTSSARRKNQLLLFREDLKIKDLRGNVPTRVNKLSNGEYDGILLAKAGLNRLDLDLSSFFVVDLLPQHFIPAPAQGALGLQIRDNDHSLKKIISKLNDPNTNENVNFERNILNGIGGGCHSPFGAYSKLNQNGERNTWVTFANKVEETPYRFATNSNDVSSIIAKFKTSFKNKNIWISRSLKEGSVFKKILSDLGIEVVGKSLIDKKIIKQDSLPNCDWIFINSAFALDSIINLKLYFKTKKIAAFGKATAKHIQKNGIKVDFVGEGTPENVAKSFANSILSDDVVFFPSSDVSLGSVQEKISDVNKIVKITYKTTFNTASIDNQDFLVFTSPSNVAAFLVFNKFQNEKIISIGSSTTNALKNAGAGFVYQAYESSELSLADSVLSLI
ncbi:MAG: hydroxymethylbilane synthase [Crocinitomicaceae bacterium]|nr:hydroxymethylbilane synthase [Crocinitomicaceae bacterium]|tara:strand:+ start:6993 stop:8546 length:1554 start_codon:yes stop_codon:yes gene_type:complete